jgi:hypothetical protein
MAEGRASEMKALQALDIIDFYHLLAHHLKQYKPTA